MSYTVQDVITLSTQKTYFLRSFFAAAMVDPVLDFPTRSEHVDPVPAAAADWWLPTVVGAAVVAYVA